MAKGKCGKCKSRSKKMSGGKSKKLFGFIPINRKKLKKRGTKAVLGVAKAVIQAGIKSGGDTDAMKKAATKQVKKHGMKALEGKGHCGSGKTRHSVRAVRY